MLARVVVNVSRYNNLLINMHSGCNIKNNKLFYRQNTVKYKEYFTDYLTNIDNN